MTSYRSPPLAAKRMMERRTNAMMDELAKKNALIWSAASYHPGFVSEEEQQRKIADNLNRNMEALRNVPILSYLTLLINNPTD